MAGELPGLSPYSYALNNPIVYKDVDGKLPILPFLLKAGAAGAADMLTQAFFAYYFDPDVETIEQAFEKVNWWQVLRSTGEGVLPWKVPGGKVGKAGATAMGDVLINAVNKGSDYTQDEAIKDFAIGFLGDLGGGGLEILVDKYGKRVYQLFEELNIKLPTTGGGILEGEKGKGLDKLQNNINPEKGLENCLACSIALEQKITKGLNNAVKKGAINRNLMKTVKESFPNAKRSPAYSHVGLSMELNNVSSNSVIIIGYFRKQHMPKDYNAHAFNAVKNKDGSWKYIDAQRGKVYTKAELDEAFGRYDVIETSPTIKP